MKFYMVVKYYLESLSFKFHEDPCTNARTKVINVRTRKKTCAHARGVQNVKIFDMKLALWFFPLHYTSGVTTKNFSHLAYAECPPLGTPIIKRLASK